METNELKQNSPNETPTKNSGNKGLIAALGVALLGSLGGNFYQYNQSQKSDKEIAVMTVDLADTESAREVLQAELDRLTADFEQSQTVLNEKDALLTQKDQEIFEKQKQIQSILNKSNVTESELKQAQRMINSLNSDIAQYKVEIAQLKAQNDSLIAVNDTLQISQANLTNELFFEKQRADDTEHKMKSTFSVSNYQIKGLKVRNSGKEVETDKAKRIDKLRVSFDLDPNQHADSGSKEIYIAIYKPDGKLGKFKGASYGELETVSQGIIEYSDKVQFDYAQGSKQNILFDWEDFEFPRGMYKIDLYQNGMKIGQKSIELR